MCVLGFWLRVSVPVSLETHFKYYLQVREYEFNLCGYTACIFFVFLALHWTFLLGKISSRQEQQYNTVIYYVHCFNLAEAGQLRMWQLTSTAPTTSALPPTWPALQSWWMWQAVIRYYLDVIAMHTVMLQAISQYNVSRMYTGVAVSL